MRILRSLLPLAIVSALFCAVRACRAPTPRPTPPPAPTVRVAPPPPRTPTDRAGGVQLAFLIRPSAIGRWGLLRLTPHAEGWKTEDGIPFAGTTLDLGGAPYGLPPALERRLRDAFAPHLPEGCLRADLRLSPDGHATLVSTTAEGGATPCATPLF